MNHPDPKSLGHHNFGNNLNENLLSKIDSVNSKLIDAKRKFKESFDL